MNRCPSCSSTFVQPIRPRVWELLRVRFTSRRPHECWHCGWRGWMVQERDDTPRPAIEPSPLLITTPAPGERKRPSSPGPAAGPTAPGTAGEKAPDTPRPRTPGRAST